MEKSQPTIGLLLTGKPKKASDPLDDIIKGSGEEDEDEELPEGLVSAVAEMRSTESDEDAARALMRAVNACSGVP